MKVWLNNDYNIVKDDGVNIFGKGNNMFDYISVYIPTETIAQDNTLPMFNFLLANGRTSGVRTHNQVTTTDGEYTVFTYRLESNLLSVKGILTITILINWYNANDKAIMTKHVSVIGNVVNNIVVSDDILIITDENGEEIVRSLVADIGAINNRLATFEAFKINKVDATVTNTTGTPEVEVVESGGAKAPNYTFNFKNIKGEQGIQGIQGEKGEKGEKGDDGVLQPLPTAFYSLHVDEQTGELYMLADDIEEAPIFEYDEETGMLYVLQTEDDKTLSYANGDDLTYGNIGG